MSDKPTDYFVAYIDEALWQTELAKAGGHSEDIDPVWVEKERNAKTLLAARAIAGSLIRRGEGSAVRIYKRMDIRDDTPASVTWETWWAWDEELLEDDEQLWLR